MPANVIASQVRLEGPSCSSIRTFTVQSRAPLRRSNGCSVPKRATREVLYIVPSSSFIKLLPCPAKRWSQEICAPSCKVWQDKSETGQQPETASHIVQSNIGFCSHIEPLIWAVKIRHQRLSRKADRVILKDSLRLVAKQSPLSFLLDDEAAIYLLHDVHRVFLPARHNDAISFPARCFV